MSVINNPSSGGGSPTGSAGGDLGGTYPNPEVVSAGNDAIKFTTAGHIIPNTTAPSAGGFDSSLGTVTSISVTGSDTAFIVNFTTGSVSASTINTIFDVTLNTGYSNKEYVIFVGAGNVTSSSPVFGGQTYALPSSGTIIAVHSATGSPASALFNSSTAYVFTFMTIGAGATS